MELFYKNSYRLNALWSLLFSMCRVCAIRLDYKNFSHKYQTRAYLVDFTLDNALNTGMFTHLPCYTTISTTDYQYLNKVKQNKNVNLSTKTDQPLWTGKYIQHHFNFAQHNIENQLKLTMNRSSRPEVFCKNGVLRKLVFLENWSLAQVFSCVFCEISRKTFFHRTPLGGCL